MSVNFGPAGTLGAGRTCFPAGASPPPLRGRPAGNSRNELDLAGRANPSSPELQGPRSLCRGCKPWAVFATLFGPFSFVLQTTWIPSTPGAHTPVSFSHLGVLSAGSRLQARVVCAGKALGPGGHARGTRRSTTGRREGLAPLPPSYPREPRLLASVFQQWSETTPSSRRYSGLL